MDESRPPPLLTNPHLGLLVLRCQAGDEAAFAQLFRAFGPRTLAYLRGLLPEEAEDVQHEVWGTVYRQLAGLADPRVFRTWLYRVTRHKAIDQLRKLRRERSLFLDAEAGAAIAVPETLEDWKEDWTLDGALERLSPIHREVVLLRFRDELSYAEIAAVLGCSIGTVRSRLFLARQRLGALRSAASVDVKHGPLREIDS